MPLREFIEINAAGNGPGKPAFSKAKEPKGKLIFLIFCFGRRFSRENAQNVLIFWLKFRPRLSQNISEVMEVFVDKVVVEYSRTKKGRKSHQECRRGRKTAGKTTKNVAADDEKGRKSHQECCRVRKTAGKATKNVAADGRDIFGRFLGIFD